MADLEKVWNNVFTKGSRKAQDKLRKVHANNPRFQTWIKSQGMEGGSPSAAAAKKVKVEPRKIIAVKPDSIRALNAARQQAYLAKGGRQPIGAMGSGGSNVMAGAGQSTIKDLKASIKAGFNPRVSLDPYESERAKKTGPRSLKMKKEEVQVDEAMSPEAAKKKRIFDLKLKMIKKVANYKSRTKSSKVDEPHSSLNPASDMKLSPKAPSGGGKNYYKEETQIDEVTGYEGVKDRTDMIKRAAAMNRMGKDVFLARVKTRADEIKKEKASKELAKIRHKAMSALAKEEVQIDEVSKKEAEVALGGPVKDKPKGPAGKLPLGYRMARSAARRAMKGAVSAVHKSMERTMQKEDVNEAVKDAADVGEYDYEGDMAKSQLRSIMANSKRMHDMLEENTNLPEWVQSKITLAEDYISTASNYMQGEMNEEVEQVDEANMRFDYEAAARPKSSDVKNFLNRDKNPRAAAASKKYIRRMTKLGGLGPNQTKKDTEAHMKAHFEEVEQVNEISEPYGTKKLRRQMAIDDRMAARDAAHPFVEPEWLTKEKAKKAAQAAEKAKVKKEEVEQVDEKINLVKAKMGTVIKDFKKSDAPQFKGKSMEKRRQMAIAAKLGAEREAGMREEVVTEAEGKVAVTPKEKALAAHHGDPKRITYGDVIKARLKSVATKKMGK